MIDGNGDNRFWIEVKSRNKVYDDEWAAILRILNLTLQNFDGGKFSNVGAYLCENDNQGGCDE